MCIALLSNAHPSYSLILINNRDEFLNRPTAPASWWPDPHSHVLGGRDLLRDVHGTWLGVTKQGRVAVLTNFRSENTPAQGLLSRGAIIRAFLTEDVHDPGAATTNTESFVKQMIGSESSRKAGGFSLICGNIGEPLAVISNTSSSEGELPWIMHPQTVSTVGLSNAAFEDRGWKKVAEGKEKLAAAIEQNAKSGKSEDEFIRQLLELLSNDTLPRFKADGRGLSSYIAELKNTILVPPLGQQTDPPAKRMANPSETNEVAVDRENLHLGGSGPYGTQKQTVVLVSRNDSVRFLERTLYDEAGIAVPIGHGDRDFTFDLERRATEVHDSH